MTSTSAPLEICVLEENQTYLDCEVMGFDVNNPNIDELDSEYEDCTVLQSNGWCYIKKAKGCADVEDQTNALCQKYHTYWSKQSCRCDYNEDLKCYT